MDTMPATFQGTIHCGKVFVSALQCRRLVSDLLAGECSPTAGRHKNIVHWIFVLHPLAMHFHSTDSGTWNLQNKTILYFVMWDSGWTNRQRHAGLHFYASSLMDIGGNHSASCSFYLLLHFHLSKKTILKVYFPKSIRAKTHRHKFHCVGAFQFFFTTVLHM